MSLRMLSITLLVFAVCLCLQTSAGNRRFPTRRFRPCCTSVSTENVSSNVTGDTYHVQSARSKCVNAIIFKTNFGPHCADPDAEWVRNLTATMNKL